jgi:hypothetical protein
MAVTVKSLDHLVLTVADVAQRLTAPERAAVVAGKATGAVAGVPSGESGVLSYDVLGATHGARWGARDAA